MNSQDGLGETHTNLAIRLTAEAGVAANAVIVPRGWEEGSSLKSVVTLDGEDLTLDFTESPEGAGIVSEEATTGETLLILFIAAHPKGGSLTRGR